MEVEQGVVGSLRVAGMEVKQSMPQSMLLGVEGRGLGMVGRIWCSCCGKGVVWGVV